MIPCLVLNQDQLANLQRLQLLNVLIQLFHVGVVSLSQSLLPVFYSVLSLLIY